MAHGQEKEEDEQGESVKEMYGSVFLGQGMWHRSGSLLASSGRAEAGDYRLVVVHYHGEGTGVAAGGLVAAHIERSSDRQSL